MRFLKVILITVGTVFIASLATYSARIGIINNLAKEQLNLYQLSITCLQINVRSDLSLAVDKLCLQHPKANIEINKLTLNWHYKSPIELTDVNVNDINIIGTDHLFARADNVNEDNSQAANHSVTQQLSNLLRPAINQIQKFQLPTKIAVNKISYSPFNASDSVYLAKFSLSQNNALLSLSKNLNENIVGVELNRVQEKFSLDITSNLKRLKGFAAQHQLPVTTELENIFKDLAISGALNAKLTYENEALKLTTKLNDIVVKSESGIANSGAFQLTAAFNFNSHLPITPNNSTFDNSSTKSSDNSELSLSFTKENFMSLNYNQSHILAILEKHKTAPAIIALLENNPIDELKITLPNNSLLALNNKKIDLSAIEVSASGDHRIHKINLARVNAKLNSNSVNKLHQLKVENFTLDSQINVAELAELTPEPITLHLSGSLEKLENNIALHLTQASTIQADNILLSKAGKIGQNKMLFSAKALKTSVAGNIKFLLDKPLNDAPSNTLNNALNVKLDLDSNILNLTVPKAIQVDNVNITSKINGNLADMNINAIAQADNVKLGSMIVSGPALSPKIQLAGSAVQLTDLLSLNVQLPTKVELIDGLLDYNVSTQITDFSKLNNTPFDVSVAVTSASGDIDGIWLQELNWQQHFTLLAGKITTLPSNKENLTVELIETPTPISKLSINTNWTFNKSFAFSANKLKADVLGGSFSIPKIQWPFEHGHSVNVQLKSIDLEQVLALDKKQGIVVTGDISGQLPVTFDGEKYIIENGELYNISNGLIQVMDNPAVAELKANNSQLQLAFDALQNLHYHQLSSAVSMADDGYMLLETVIKGRNPDIDNDVNLNLNLSYDLLGLLESLSITQRFEEGIIKGLQKTKE